MKDDLHALLVDEEKRERAPDNNFLKVLIVDDEPTVHDITALVLKNFQYRGYRLELKSAYSATEAREVLASQGPFALILLDVIMETDDAGLGLARYIREELKDPMVRIILRTGQPGMVPQRQVMRDYEIDDYKEKAELTSERFDAAVTASVRTYLGFQRLEQSRLGLIRILNAIKDIESSDIEQSLANRILDQMESVMNRINSPGIGSIVVVVEENGERIVSGRGIHQSLQDCDLDNFKNPEMVKKIRQTLKSGNTYHDDHHIMTTLIQKNGGRYLAYIEDNKEIGDMERYLVELYASHVNVTLDNRILARELVNTQREIITALGEVIETRSDETGQHVQRVGEIAKLLAEKSGFNSSSSEMVRHAAPLHDIGKVAIPDRILKKPGKLTEEEYEIMKTHSKIGHDILKSSNKDILQLAARICLEHHEWWNGNGYPNGLSGKNISVEARICHIADVLDALRSKRIYKDAIPLTEAMEIIRKARGTQFDPDLVDILFENRESVQMIYRTYED
jgi:response regulator RpfG family c-di-GMP phosphodiesterase